MAKLKVFTFPDTVLTQKSKPVERVEKTYFKLADGMLETMYDFPGIGLAANQVGVLERIIVVDTEYNILEMDELEPGEEIPKDGEVVNGRIISGRKPQIMINPEIIYREGKTRTEEGCLSVPKYWAEVDRAEKIKMRYQDIDGLEHVLSAEGILAICIQHEIDHLDGTLFIDRLNQLKKDFAKKKLLKARGLR
jgi:peptide deformylase